MVDFEISFETFVESMERHKPPLTRAQIDALINAYNNGETSAQLHQRLLLHCPPLTIWQVEEIVKIKEAEE